MAVIRISKTKGYTVMSNYHLRDKNLSLKAKGLLSMMLSLPDGWHYTVRGLASVCKEGVESISSGIRELDKAGYVCRHQANINGKFQEIEYVIYEIPQKKLSPEADGNESDASVLPSPADSAGNVPGSVTGMKAISDSAGQNAVASEQSMPHPMPPCTENPDTEKPYAGMPHLENPDTENPGTGKPNALLNTKKPSTEEEITDLSNYQSINHRGAAAQEKDRIDGMDAAQRKFLDKIGAQRMAGDFEYYRDIVKENIEFDFLCRKDEFQQDTLEGIVELMVEAICSSAPYIRIAGQDFPQSVVKSRLLKLNTSHIEYVLTCLARNTTKIGNMKSYLLTALYNSYTTIEPFYQNWVQSDDPSLAMN